MDLVVVPCSFPAFPSSIVDESFVAVSSIALLVNSVGRWFESLQMKKFYLVLRINKCIQQMQLKHTRWHSMSSWASEIPIDDYNGDQNGHGIHNESKQQILGNQW